MKLDTEYSSIEVCPETEKQLHWSDIYEANAVCNHCGHDGDIMTHHKTVPGRWNRPSLFERLFQGKKSEFLRKEDEDKIWDTLKG